MPNRQTDGAGVKHVSIIIPCFNAASTVAATIESALLQSDCDFEIVVVDDGSTDNSLEIIRSISPAIHVISQPNRGVSVARNRGSSETSSEWLVFLDADDLLVGGTLVSRLHTAATSGADVVICDWQHLTDGDAPVLSVDWRKMQDAPDIAVVDGCVAPPAALLYRRSLIGRSAAFVKNFAIVKTSA